MVQKLFLRTFLSIFCTAILFSMTNFAHDAGMSSLNVEFAEQKLTIRADYSLREIEKIALLENESQMSVLAKDSVVLSVDGRQLVADESNYFFSDDHTATFIQRFRGITGKKAEIKSLLISQLNPNHKQFFYVRRSDGQTTSSEILTTDNNSIAIDFEKLELNTSFIKFLPLGIEHIIFGYDHLLFLFALLLTVKSLGEIVKIVTSFTVAHSITLSLATLEIIQISTSLIEPLIALSIIFVGLENLFKKEQKNRWMLTYVFGLVHGFGFASALQEVGIGKGFGVIEPLLSFNLGVEIGQVTVILLVLPLLWKLQKLQMFSTYFIPIGSCLVVIAGIYWLIERTLF